MQNNNQNQINNLNNPLQLESKQVVYFVDVSIELDDCSEFVEWLKSKGHYARVVDFECSFVNGVAIGEHETANTIFNDLRLLFKK